MKCVDIMTSDPACCPPTESTAKVAKMMRAEDVGSIPVCDNDQSRRLLGIVTDRDLALHVVAEGRDPHTTRVQDVMTTKPLTCHPEDDLRTALDAMQKYQVRRIPVVDQSGHLLGIISQADIAIRAEAPDQTADTVGEISKPFTDRVA
jgi:CBS domain-containing protein